MEKKYFKTKGEIREYLSKIILISESCSLRVDTWFELIIHKSSSVFTESIKCA